MKINGRELAEKKLQELQKIVARLKENGITPHLAIILVGNDPASKAYVRQKEEKAQFIGAQTTIYELSKESTTQELLGLIQNLNENRSIHGVIVQRPLPSRIDSSSIDQAVLEQKDVDGFRKNSSFVSPITLAVNLILEYIFNSSKKDDQKFENWLTKQDITIVGKGETGGKPIIDFFTKQNIPITIVDSKTEDAKQLTTKANIVISAVGKPRVITPDMLKQNVILISIGLHKGEDERLHGDYDEEEIKDVASFYTPSPGGVGPVNVTMLLSNLVDAAENSGLTR